MDPDNEELFRERARIIKALAHPSRLFIVDRLSKRDYCVNELAEMIGVDISTVSKHLSVLKNAGLVRDKKVGQKVFYRLSVPCVLNFFSCVEAVISSQEKRRVAARL